MEYGAPKLAWLRRYLKRVVGQGKQRVILWVYWPLSQWYIQEVYHPFYPTSYSDNRSDKSY